MSDISLLDRIATVRNTVENFYGKGVFAYVKYLYYGLFRVNTFVVFELPLDRDFEEKPLGDDVVMLKPTLEELERIREGRNLPKAFSMDKIDGLRCCYLLLKNEEPVYIHWIGYHGDKSRFVRLGPKTTRITYIFTVPEHRGGGYYYKMIPITANELRKQGMERLITIIHDGNISAIKSVTKAGFREVTRMKALGQFNRTIDM
jgi:GNAT superfamily N-acetyltransferase